MRDLERTELRVFLFRSPVQAAPCKADNTDDDENNADDRSGFHEYKVRANAGLG